MRAGLLLSVFVLANSRVYARPATSIESRVATVVAHMESPDRGVRNAAEDELLALISEGQAVGFDPEYSDFLGAFSARHPDLADRLKLGLINLLKADNDHPSLPAGYSPEENSEHYALAIELVASLDDERAIPALVGAMKTGGIAGKGVAKYGQKALGPVLKELTNPNPLMRARAVGLGIYILQMKNDAAAHAEALDMIRKAITDPEFLIRSEALYSIESLTDREQFVPALREMVQRDPFIVPGQTDYPLRVRAKALLEKIANR